MKTIDDLKEECRQIAIELGKKLDSFEFQLPIECANNGNYEALGRIESGRYLDKFRR